MAASTSEPNWSTVLAALAEVEGSQLEMLELLRDSRTVDGVTAGLTSLGSLLDDTNARLRSLVDTTSEIKDLLIRALARP